MNDGRTAHIVPIVFAFAGDRIYFAIDRKPKKTRKNLRRLQNIRRQRRATVLFDTYSENWDDLSFAIVYADARILGGRDLSERTRALRLLKNKYEQYRQGPYAMEEDDKAIVVRLRPRKIVSWKARDDSRTF
jgi:PPOX class probable F420-dependent enzyme